MKCAVYVRVSTDKEEQKQSLQNQKELFLNLITERGWDLFEIYVDVQSGTKSAKRPALNRLIEDAKKNKFDIILAKELSRLARNGLLSYEIKSLAESNSIDILTLDRAIDTLSGDTNNFGLYAWLYEQESQKTSTRVKDAMKTKSLRGQFKGSIPPYGYKAEKGMLLIKDDFTPDIVKRIFNAYLSGKGFDSIARKLLEECVPTPSQIAGRRNATALWHGSSVRCILENPHYTGDLVQQRETTISVTSNKRKRINPSEHIIVENTHEPIISKQDFELVQQLINERKRKRPYAKKHLFTNILFCEDCNQGMHYIKNRRGYICGRYNKHGRTQCSSHHVIENDLIKSISIDINQLFTKISSKGIQKDIVKRVEKFITTEEHKLKHILEEIEKIKKDRTSALRMKIREEITDEEYELLIGDNRSQLNKLGKEKVKLEKVLNHKKSINFSDVLKHVNEFVQKPILNDEMLHKLIERIEIKEDGTPRIFYRFSDSFITSTFFQSTHSTPHALSVETCPLVALPSS